MVICDSSSGERGSATGRAAARNIGTWTPSPRPRQMGVGSQGPQRVKARAGFNRSATVLSSFSQQRAASQSDRSHEMPRRVGAPMHELPPQRGTPRVQRSPISDLQAILPVSPRTFNLQGCPQVLCAHFFSVATAVVFARLLCSLCFSYFAWSC